jgi:hypothetical protein
VKVTGRRATEDFATCMRELSDVHFPNAERIPVLMDNLSTHSAGTLYQAFPVCEARRLLRRLEFHYVPKRASWLNMVESEHVTPPVFASTGCSQPRKPAPKWAAPIPS